MVVIQNIGMIFRVLMLTISAITLLSHYWKAVDRYIIFLVTKYFICSLQSTLLGCEDFYECGIQNTHSVSDM